MKALFLDDIRFPPLNAYEWIIVRSFDEGVSYLENNPCPSVISFDHDLGEADEKTGYDFAKWLCDRDMDQPGFLPHDFMFVVHSMNPVGATNIKAYMNAYLTQRTTEFVAPSWTTVVIEDYDGDF